VPDIRGTSEHPFVVTRASPDAAAEEADRAARVTADTWAKRIGIGTLVLLFVQAEALAIQAWVSGHRGQVHDDGELVALDAKGIPSFQALQNRKQTARKIAFCAFDLLHLDGEMLLQLQLTRF
jgi:hypothetical protein